MLQKVDRAVLWRLTEASHQYLKVIQDSKWHTKNLQIAEVKSSEGKNDISETTDALEDGL